MTPKLESCKYQDFYQRKLPFVLNHHLNLYHKYEAQSLITFFKILNHDLLKLYYSDFPFLEFPGLLLVEFLILAFNYQLFMQIIS